MRARPDGVRPGFRTRHNYASRPGRKAAGVFLRSENTEAGSRKTAMRFMRDYASRMGACYAGGKLQLQLSG